MKSKTKEQLAPYLWAIVELGQSEIIGRNVHNPRIVWYHSFTTLKAQEDEIPWCASFMCAAHEFAGQNSTKSAAARSFLTWGEPGDGRIGDVVVLRRNGGGHVAFVHIDHKPGDQYVCCLGGNQSNRVCVSYYKSSDILGFRRASVASASKESEPS